MLAGVILFLNFISDIYLLGKKGPHERSEEEKGKYRVFKQYFFSILRQYYLSSGEDKPYLKYDR
jgi:hypothetical protein